MARVRRVARRPFNQCLHSAFNLRLSAAVNSASFAPGCRCRCCLNRMFTGKGFGIRWRFSLVV